VSKARAWLIALIDSIHGVTSEEFGTSVTKVTEKKDGETEIAKIEGFLGQFWTLAWNRQQAVRAQVMRAMAESIETGKDPSDEERKRLESETREADAMMSLFWFLVRRQFQLDGGTIGVRRGGVLVSVPEEPEDDGPNVIIHAVQIPLPPSGGILSKIFGGGKQQQ